VPIVAEPESTRVLPPRERLIVALDVPSGEAAKDLVRKLDDTVLFYKIGLELAASGEYFDLMNWLLDQGKRVFADLKFHDVPATVARAVRQMTRWGATFLTVHGERSVVEAAAAEKGPLLKILAVTVLTSLDELDLRQMGIQIDMASLVLARARQAVAAGCDGIIASGLELPALRTALGGTPIIVTPGIRPASQQCSDDQKRVVTPRLALEKGADYIVVGRPIRDAADPRGAALAIQKEIAATCA
jgi:orotidine-5'-phosphate decarboxylase